MRILTEIRKTIAYCKAISESPFFDKDFYYLNYKIPPIISPLYEVVFGYKTKNNPSIFFDTKQYYIDNPDVLDGKMNALVHYALFGKREGRKGTPEDRKEILGETPYSSFFDPAWYIEKYNSQGSTIKEIYEQYHNTGWQQGNLPFFNFDLERFASENPGYDKNPLDYWFECCPEKNYFIDRIFPEIGIKYNHQIIAYQSFFRKQQDSLVRDNILFGKSNIAILFMPDTDMQSSLWDDGLLWFNEVVSYFNTKYYSGNVDFVVTTMVGEKTVSQDILFEDNINVFRYSQISSAVGLYKKISLIVFEEYIQGFIDYFEQNTDDVILHYDNVELIIVSANSNIILGNCLKERILHLFSSVTVEYVPQTNFNCCKYNNFFSPIWYEKEYLISSGNGGLSPWRHYCIVGWRRHYKPFKCFDIDEFYRQNKECNTNPLLWWFNRCPYKKFFTRKETSLLDFGDGTKHLDLIELISKAEQNYYIENELPYNNSIERIMIIMVPPLDVINGGVMSFCGMHKLCRELEYLHGYKVIAVTVPGSTTHSRFTMFDNDMRVFRYDQVEIRMHRVKDIMLWVPEQHAMEYYRYLMLHEEDPILRINKRHLNIMNQNIDLMPEPKELCKLKKYFPQITQTDAHISYCNRKNRDLYGMPCHWLIAPIFWDYCPAPFEEKEEIIVYSPDQSEYKERILDKIRKSYPDMRQIEVRNMPYREYCALIKKAKFCMTFGEGLDGYFSQPYCYGGISFAIWNDRFFTEKYKDLPTVFRNGDDALNRIISLIETFNNKDTYESVVEKVITVMEEDYCEERGPREQLIDFFEGKYDFA